LAIARDTDTCHPTQAKKAKTDPLPVAPFSAHGGCHQNSSCADGLMICMFRA
jgi:hypothetical protein